MRRATCTPRPLPGASFDDALERIMAVTGASSQTELAERLGVRQRSVAAARLRRSVPDAWLVTLVGEFRANPLWILRGTAAKYLEGGAA